MYRAVTARALYLSQDRSDIQYAVKELSRNMSAPNRGREKTDTIREILARQTKSYHQI